VRAPKIFVSHTDVDEVQRRATTGIMVELRRAGFQVWLDREQGPPTSTTAQRDAGPTPENPLFHHILDALVTSDAVLFVISRISFEREYVRLEFDPRVLHQKFEAAHPNLPSERLPFFLALVEPLPGSSALWHGLVDTSFAGRVLNLTGAGETPLILPTVLNTMIAQIAPDRLLPLDPVMEWAIRFSVEKQATEAPGCPKGVTPSTWRRLENLFGLGPLFPNSLSSLTEDELRYGIYRLGDTMRFRGPKPNAPPGSLAGMDWRGTELVSPYIALWTANALLRSRTLRLHTGSDIAVDSNLPSAIREFSKERNIEAVMSSMLQYAYACMTTPAVKSTVVAGILKECSEYFASVGALALSGLAGVLLGRVTREPVPQDSQAYIAGLGCDCRDADLRRLHHAVLDAAFPGPRVEATDAYRAAARASREHCRETARNMTNVQFGRQGAEQYPEDYWQKVKQCPRCGEWYDAKLERCPQCGVRHPVKS
jgi:hypothetical protein